MKQFTVYAKTTGEILRYGITHDEIAAQCMSEDEGIIEGFYDDNEHYINFVEKNYYNHDTSAWDSVIEAEAVAKPTSPGISYNWDATEKEWVEDIETAKKRIKGLIENERDRLDNDVIVYDSKNLDANKTAKDNIMQKISELRARIDASEDPDYLTWRDADNVTHTWTVLSVYRLWMYRLLIAIAHRATALRIASWTHKDAVDELETVADIEDYDYTTGWD